MRARDLGRPVTEPALRPKLIDPFLDKIEEWVERSEGKVRADIVHERLVPMGFAGAERTTRSGERRRPVTASAAQARSASTRPSRKQKRRNARSAATKYCAEPDTAAASASTARVTCPAARPGSPQSAKPSRKRRARAA